MIFYVLLTIAALLGFYLYKLRRANYWKERGIPFAVDHDLITVLSLGFTKNPLKTMIIDKVNKYPEARYLGCFNFGTPYIYLKDPEIIKMIAIKHFDHFVNRLTVLNEDVDPLIGKSLVSLKDQKWKDMRATLSPSFTSSKMRSMFVLISECGEQFVDYFSKKAQTENSEQMVVDMKDVFSRFTNDVIATTAFGLKVDSLLHPTNDFFMMGKKLTADSFQSVFTFFMCFVFPKLMKKLGLRLFPNSVTSFFKTLILDTIKLREKENIVRPDMIHLLMEAKKGNLKHEDESEEKHILDGFSVINESYIEKNKRNKKLSLTDEDLVSQAFLFFFAGFETSSTSMSFTAHQLAINPTYQTMLQTEIDQVLYENSGKLTYESLNSMKYMDMVVSESLRMWNPAVMAERVCGTSCKIPGPFSKDNENRTVTIEPGTGVWIPIYPIHYDPKYFPNPNQFNPERFSDENKRKINPLTYMPFGVGPRVCIGSRFALMEIKIALFYILSKFDFVVCEKTKIPLEIKFTSLNITAKGGFWLALKARNK